MKLTNHKTLSASSSSSSSFLFESFLSSIESSKYCLTLTFSGESHRLTNLDCFRPEQYLDDTVIMFFIKYFINIHNKQKDFTVFDVAFWKTLSSKDASSVMNFTRRKKTSTRVNIFRERYIIIPINEASHWFVIIICMNISGVSTILLLDSLMDYGLSIYPTVHEKIVAFLQHVCPRTHTHTHTHTHILICICVYSNNCWWMTLT